MISSHMSEKMSGRSETLIVNGISNSWADACYYHDNAFFRALAGSYIRLFHYDCLMTVVFLTLIILPVLFNIYSVGIQQRLRSFYDQARVVFIRFLFIGSFALGMCTIFHLTIHQVMPCVTWDGRSISPLSGSSRTPNDDLVIILILCEAIWSLDAGWLWFRRIVVVLLYGLVCASAVIMGYSSILQAFVSAFIGLWIIALNKFIPPIGIPICAGICLVIVAVLFGINLSDYGWEVSLISESLHLAYRSMIVLLISVGMLCRFAWTREKFDWFKVSWAESWTYGDSGIGQAIIPSMVADSEKDNFGWLLSKDLADSLVGFVLYLVGNYILYELDENYTFMFE